MAQGQAQVGKGACKGGCSREPGTSDHRISYVVGARRFQKEKPKRGRGQMEKVKENTCPGKSSQGRYKKGI